MSLAGVSDFKSRFPQKAQILTLGNRQVYNLYAKWPHKTADASLLINSMKTLWQTSQGLRFKLLLKILNLPHLIIHGDADTSCGFKRGFGFA